MASSYLAARLLRQAAQSLGWQTNVECYSQLEPVTVFTPAQIEDAELVLVAADTPLDLSRFVGKSLYHSDIQSALHDPRAWLQRGREQAVLQVEGIPAALKKPQHTLESTQAGPYQHLLTGVSFMLPMVVAGGLIIALSFVFGIEAFKEEGSLAAALMQIGGASAFALMIPVLSGYIAYSIADRPGIAPGMIGGMLASTLGAGFIGGIIGGFLAGYSARYLARKVPLPASLTALKPILIIPLFASLFTGLVMIYVVGGPVALMMTTMTDFLNNMGSANAVLLGIIIGTMMCFDMGGPVNKAAYAFSVGLLASQTYGPMAAAMAAGMVPALAMGIATFLARRKFNKSEQEAGKASFVLGLCFISEGAIPFAARDPLRVIPCCMLGGALTGALSMFFGAKLLAPHGGIFVFFIPNAIQQLLWYVPAIAAGSLVSGVLYSVLKRSDAQMLAGK